jgi:hypothetical protein
MSADRDAAMEEITNQIEFRKINDPVEIGGFEPIQLDEETSAEQQNITTPTFAIKTQKDRVKSFYGKAVDKVANLPDPGTVGTPLTLLLLFYLILIPVNGYPRISWLWFALLGNATLSGEQTTPWQQKQGVTPTNTGTGTGTTIPLSQPTSGVSGGLATPSVVPQSTMISAMSTMSYHDLLSMGSTAG